MYITAQGPRLRNDLYCVEWDVKLYYTIPYHTSSAETAAAAARIMLTVSSEIAWTCQSMDRYYLLSCESDDRCRHPLTCIG